MTTKKPILFLFIGYPGAGKTTIAKIIASELRAKHIWADVERHKLFKNPTHAQAESNALYDQLSGAVDYLLAQGRSVVFDTNFNHYSDREKLKSIADSRSAKTIIIWVKTPKKVAKFRSVKAKVSRNLYKMRMTNQQFESITKKLEKPKPSEKVITIDGTDINKQAVLKLLKPYI